MALDRTHSMAGVTSTSSPPLVLQRWLSSFRINESASSAAAAEVYIRDVMAVMTAPTLTQGVAGNPDVGVHIYMLAKVTQWGESYYGSTAETTIVTSAKKVTVGWTAATDNARNQLVGYRIYRTKADAPATGVTPTSAQWFRLVADVSTTLAAGENTKTLPEATISVADATGLATAGRVLITTTNGIQVVSYTAISTNDLTGCTGGTGIMATGGAVTQPMIGNPATVTYLDDVADASAANTRPSLINKSGPRVIPLNLAANQSVGDHFSNPLVCENGGGFLVEVVSGTVDYSISGQ